jgi:glycosyltransferase involved in cell wall biosynthesis
MSDIQASPRADAPAPVVVERPVVAGTYYLLRADARDDQASAGSRALVAQVRFLDASGAEIPGVAPGCSVSERFGAFVYLPSVPPGAALPWAEAAVGAPEGASTVRLAIHRWKASPALTLSENGVELADERSLALFTETLEVKSGFPYQLELTIKDEGKVDRAAVVSLEFQDAAGNVLPGPHRGTNQSPRFGAYLYAGTAADGLGTSVVHIASPERAARLVVRGHRWHGGKTLALAGPISLVSEGIEGMDNARWSLVPSAGVELELPLPPGPAGLATVRLGCLSSLETVQAVAEATLSFLDASGRPIVAEEGTVAAAFSAATTLQGGKEPIVREFLAWRPEQASRVRIAVKPTDAQGSLFVERQAGFHPLSCQLPLARVDQVVAPGQRSEQRVRVFNAWQSVLAIKALRTRAPDIEAPEVCLFFGDAQGKTLEPKGCILDNAGAKQRQAGKAIFVSLLPEPTGEAGLEGFAATVRFRAPAGATTVVIRVTNPSSQADLVTRLNVLATDTLVDSEVSPAMAADLQALEESSPEAARLTLDQLLALHADDQAVMVAAMDAFRRLGDVGRLEAIASRAASVQGAAAGKLRLKAKHMLALVRELDTHWLPDVGGIEAAPARPRSADAGLRVAHLFKTTVPYENTGGAIRCMNIVKFQQRIGMAPIVVSPLGYPGRGGSGAPWEREDVEGIPHFRLNGLSRDDVRSVPVTRQLDFTALLTAHLLNQEGVDLIQASSGYRGYEQALVGLAVARRLGVPFVYEVRSYHEHTWRPMVDWVMDREMTQRRMAQENRCMREADAVVTICETMKEGLVARGIPAEKIFVVPNSVDLEQFKPQAPDLALRERLGLKAATTAGYISNLSAREGHAVLLRGVALARARGADLGCLIVGAGPELDKLKALAQSLGIGDYVVFTGEVPHHEVDRYYALIDLFVVPRVEDFASDYVTPMKPFEAMAMERPVIISDRPALQEVVEPGVRGDIFRAGDAAHLADRMIALHERPADLKKFALAGRDWIAGERTWEKTIRIYRDVYAYAQAARDIRG